MTCSRPAFAPTSLLALGLVALGCGAVDVDEHTPTEAVERPAHRLTGFATLAAATFLDGPTSGQFIDSTNGVTTPFLSQQPLQGISSAVLLTPGVFLAVSDNGFGAPENSADYLLRTYELTVQLDAEGRGTIEHSGGFVLSDPDRLLGFELVADREFLPGSDIPTPAAIREAGLLTGADLDIESIRPATDGGWWFGDELGPFLIRTDAVGKVIAPPLRFAGVTSPQNPFDNSQPTIGRSAGFEPLALAPSGELLAMLEKPLTGAPVDELAIFTIDPADGAARGATGRYRLEPEAIGATDLTHVVDDIYLVIERDDGDGPTAEFKRVYAVDFGQLDADGFPRKRLLVDLLDIPDPDGVGGMGPRFSFPFQTPETVVLVDEHTIVLLCDNNFPFGNARAEDQPGDPGCTPAGPAAFALRLPKAPARHVHGASMHLRTGGDSCPSGRFHCSG